MQTLKALRTEAGCLERAIKNAQTRLTHLQQTHYSVQRSFDLERADELAKEIQETQVTLQVMQAYAARIDADMILACDAQAKAQAQEDSAWLAPDNLAHLFATA